jgi:membrane protease YdiL (CAAX protease family)
MDFKEKIKTEWQKLTADADKRAVVAILYITVAVGLYFYFGIQDFFEKTFGAYFSSPAELLYYKYIYHNFMAFVFFFLLSLPVSKLLLKQKAADVGLKFQEKKSSLILMLISLAIVPLISLSAVADAEMSALYPLGGSMIFLNAGFFILYYVSYIAYYFGWEYLFRGFGFFSISEKYGPMLAIAVTTMISALIHSSIGGFGKPFSETFSAIFGGLIFGFIAYKTKSIYPSLLMHFVLGFCLDMFVYFI